MTPTAVAVTLLAAAALLAGPAATRAAAPGTFAGQLAAPLPARGIAEVHAIDASTGSVVAARRLTGRSFSLHLPGGAYVVAATVISRSGGAAPATTATGVTLRAGQRRVRSRLRIRRPRRTKSGRAALVQESGRATPGSVAVMIESFTGATGQFAVFNAGLTEMLITDVVANDDCEKAVTSPAVRRLAAGEAALQRSPYFDRSTRVRRDFVQPDVRVTGTLHNGASGLQYAVTIRDARNGATVSTLTGSLSYDDLFAGADQLAGRLNGELCRLRDVYELRLVVQGQAIFATHSATGRVDSTLRAVRTGRRTRVWKGQSALAWEALAFNSLTGCSYINAIPGTSPWSATLTDAGNRRLRVDWAPAAVGPLGISTATAFCPGGPSIPGQPGPALQNIGPLTFTVPYEGGTQALSGDLAGAWINSGPLVVRPAGVERR